MARAHTFLLAVVVVVCSVSSARARVLVDLFKRERDPFHRECPTDPSTRQLCGRRGNRVSEWECKARGCCWDDRATGDTLGCFLPLRFLKAECDVTFEDKDDCGYYGITEGECLMNGCCYRPADRVNEPDCFYKRKDAVRLVNGDDENSGRVEIMHDNEWGTVCDDMFGKDEADVICKSLGYSSGVPKIEAYFGEGSGTIWMDSLDCNGDEDALADCPFEGWGIEDCSHSEDAGVICSGSGDNYTDGDSSEESSGYDYNYDYGYWDYRSAKKPSK